MHYESMGVSFEALSLYPPDEFTRLRPFPQ